MEWPALFHRVAITSGENNLTYCYRTWAVQSYLQSGANMRPNMLHWTHSHSSPYPKWHLNQFSHFCTAHSSESLYFTIGHPLPLKMPIRPLHMGI